MCSSDEMPKEFEILTGIHGCKLSFEDCNSQACSHFFTCEITAKALRQVAREIYEDAIRICNENEFDEDATTEAIRKRLEELDGK